MLSNVIFQKNIIVKIILLWWGGGQVVSELPLYSYDPTTNC